MKAQVLQKIQSIWGNISDGYAREDKNLTSLYDEGEQIGRQIEKDEWMNQDTKNKVLELKRVVNQKNDEIGQYIDEKDESIDKQAKELKSLIKEKKELKFRVEEAWGNIAHLEIEIEKM